MPNTRATLVLCAILSCLAACQTSSHPNFTSSQPATQSPPPPASPAPPQSTANGTSLSNSDLHDVLAELAKGHHDKIQLAWWVNAPLLRSADPVFKKFYKDLAVPQKELAAELEKWAKTHHMDLTYHYTSDTFSQAQKIMEDRQEKLVRADNKDDFGRDMLIDEWQDYEFTISLITALQPAVHDPALQAYLQKSLLAHKSGDLQVQAFLKKYKYGG